MSWTTCCGFNVFAKALADERRQRIPFVQIQDEMNVIQLCTVTQPTMTFLSADMALSEAIQKGAADV